MTSNDTTLENTLNELFQWDTLFTQCNQKGWSMRAISMIPELFPQEIRTALEHEYERKIKMYIERLPYMQQQKIYQRLQIATQQLPVGHGQFDFVKMPAFYHSLPDSLFRPQCQMFGFGCCKRPVKHLISISNYQWLCYVPPPPPTHDEEFKNMDLALCDIHFNTFFKKHNFDYLLDSLMERSRELVLENDLFHCQLGGMVHQKSDNSTIAEASLRWQERPRFSWFYDELFDPTATKNQLLRSDDERLQPGSYRICRGVLVYTYNPRQDLIDFLSTKLCRQQQIYSKYFLIDCITMKHTLYETSELTEE